MQARREKRLMHKESVKVLLVLVETLVVMTHCLLINKRREEMLSLKQELELRKKKWKRLMRQCPLMIEIVRESSTKSSRKKCIRAAGKTGVVPGVGYVSQRERNLC